MKFKLYMAATIAAMMLMGLTAYAAEGWIEDNQGWKYEKADGSLANNEWIDWNGNRYYIDFTGYMKQDAYIVSGGNGYYLGSDGAMLRDALTPDGYTIRADGTWDTSIPQQEVKKPVELTETTEDTDQRTAYILNPDTDATGWIYSKGMNDMLIVCALLGEREVTTEMLNEKELAVYQVVRSFVDKEIREDDSDYEKVVKITKFIWKKGSYADSGLQDDHTPYGILVNGKGVCESYSRSFKILANAVGLECYDVTGGNHAWNKVKVDGHWYNADITEPLEGYGAERAAYILRTDDDYWRTSKQMGSYPECVETEWAGKYMDGYVSWWY